MTLVGTLLGYGQGGLQALGTGARYSLNSRGVWLASGIATSIVLGVIRKSELMPWTWESESHPAPPCDGYDDYIASDPCVTRGCKKAHIDWYGHDHHKMRCGWKNHHGLLKHIYGGQKSVKCWLAYAGLVLAAATAGGRMPLTARSAAYVAAQSGVKFLDGLVVSALVIRRLRDDNEGKAVVGLDDQRRPKFCSTPKLVAAALYFGLRMADGWLVASVPVNTLPFVSLAGRVAPMLEPMFNYAQSGLQVLGGAASYTLNSRGAWLAAGVVSTYWLGFARRADLQPIRWEKELSNPPVPRGAEWIGVNQCRSPLSCTKPHQKYGRNGPEFHQVRRGSTVNHSLLKRLWGGTGSTSVWLGYSAFVLAAATAGGRVALTTQSVAYVASQSAVKFLDGLVVSAFVLKSLKINTEGEAIAPGFKRSCKPALQSRPALAFAALYFGLRMADGWLMASAPVNTLPFASLAGKVAPLVRR